MANRILTLLASASLCYATCVDPEVHRIYHPTRELQYDPPYAPDATESAPRLILIGDVHGMRNELEELLEATSFSLANGDRLIFAGDLVNKGPDSAGVVQLAMDLNATSVRGNHEDKVLRTWAGAEVARALASRKGLSSDQAVLEYEDSLSSGYKEALATARSLSHEQRMWLSERSLSLRLGKLAGIGEVAVVHAGLVPGHDLRAHAPWDMYNIRTLLYPSDSGQITDQDLADTFKVDTLSRLQDKKPGREWSENEVRATMGSILSRYHTAEDGAVPISEANGRWWVDTWTETELGKPEGERLTLIYGHDSKRGLQLHPYSKGLDTRCVNGVELTAMILKPTETASGEITLVSEIVSVPCPDGSS